MFARLTRRGDAIAREARKAAIERLAATQLPGVAVEAAEEGVVLSGRRLRRRVIDDAALRSFGR